MMTANRQNDFQVVKYKTKTNYRKTKFQLKELKLIDDLYTSEEILNKVHKAVEDFQKSSFCLLVTSKIQESLNLSRLSKIEDIICYGLGNFSDKQSSKYQLACLLVLKKTFSSNVWLYDPIFTKNESQCLKRLDLNIISKNEEGKRNVTNSPTIVFLPHCSQQLTNNILLSNWSPQLANCILIGNSWSDLVNASTDKFLEQQCCLIKKLQPFVTEIKLENIFKYPQTFSGTSVHIFTQENLNLIPHNFWIHKLDIPFSCDIDFISEIESLNLQRDT